MTAGREDLRGTFIHRLNPAVKLVVFLCLIQMAGVTLTLRSYTILTAVALAVQIAARVNIFGLLSKMRPFIVILLATFAMNFFFAAGLNSSLVLTYRFFLIIYFSILLSETTDAKALVSVLAMPVRGTAGKNLKVVMLVAMEFIPIFIEDAKRTVKLIRVSPEYEKHTYKVLFRPNEYIRPLIHSLLAHTDTAAQKVEQGGYAAVPISMPKAFEILIAMSAVTVAVLYAL